MISLFNPGAQAPDWWIAFVRMVNGMIEGFIAFLMQLVWYEIVYFIFGVWFLVMIVWVKQLSSKLVLPYIFFVAGYFIIGLIVINKIAG